MYKRGFSMAGLCGKSYPSVFPAALILIKRAIRHERPYQEGIATPAGLFLA